MKEGWHYRPAAFDFLAKRMHSFILPSILETVFPWARFRLCCEAHPFNLSPYWILFVPRPAQTDSEPGSGQPPLRPEARVDLSESLPNPEAQRGSRSQRVGGGDGKDRGKCSVFRDQFLKILESNLLNNVDRTHNTQQIYEYYPL